VAGGPSLWSRATHTGSLRTRAKLSSDLPPARRPSKTPRLPERSSTVIGTAKIDQNPDVREVRGKCGAGGGS
jgi:hypothetical protein